MSDKSVKFDIIPQLEVILKSIDLEDKSLLTPILKSKEVDQTDKDVINKYLKLLEIAGRPSTQMLEMEMPGRNFEVEPIDKGAIPDYIQIFLYNRKNLEASKSLMELSGRVRGEGLTEDVINDDTFLSYDKETTKRDIFVSEWYLDNKKKMKKNKFSYVVLACACAIMLAINFFAWNFSTIYLLILSGIAGVVFYHIHRLKKGKKVES